MLVFRIKPNFDHQPSEKEILEIREQWGGFIGKMAIAEKLVSTYQLGFEGKQIEADLSVNGGITIADELTLGGNMVIKANSLMEATDLAKGCPVLKMKGSVEVRSIIPMEH